MRKITKNILTIAFLFATTIVFAQAPDGFNYQAAIRDGSGEILENTNVNLRLTVLTDSPSGTTEYQETQDLTTNEYGIVNHVVGSGTIETGTFSGITWGVNDKFLKVEVSINGGPYNDMGTQQLVSVPYAIHAQSASSAQNAVNADNATNAQNAVTAQSSLDNNWNTSGNNIFSNNSGNVGIGTSNPTNKLHVQGGITSGNLNINGRVLGSFGSSMVFGNNVPNSGNTNTVIGNEAMQDNTTGFDNVAFGTGANANNTTGDKNTAIGVRAMENNTTGSGITAIGHLAGVTSNNFSNSIVIGNFAAVDASNKARIGGGGYSSIGGQVNWTAFSDKRVKDNISEQVVGLEFIKALRPVTYNYNVEKQEKLMGLTEVGDWESKKDIEKIQFSGFLAQEVEAAAKATNYNFSGVDKSGEILGLRYAEFTVPLVKAVQEQQAQIEALQQQNAELLEMINALMSK